MLEQLKEKVLKANLALEKNGLVLYTWGNVSAADRASGLVVIKPSGVSYADMVPSDMVVVDMDGNVVEGAKRPSSDTPTHLALYRAFPALGGVTHTHSAFAAAWAQAGRDIPCYGTTHADYFYGDIPCTRPLTQAEVEGDYEKNTGLVIVERLRGTDPLAVPGVLVRSHGVFAFGADAAESVFHATVLEEVAKTALLTEAVLPQASRADGYVLEKHYQRKHGKNAYYGQSPRNSG